MSGWSLVALMIVTIYCLIRSSTYTSRVARCISWISSADATACSVSIGCPTCCPLITAISSSIEGYPSVIITKKRSSCASGSGNVPSYSIGFCVAITMNGVGTECVIPSTVTCRSSIASSVDDCVFGVARLISSASTICDMIGPSLNSNSPFLWL